jgi:hypothetical protein
VIVDINVRKAAKEHLDRLRPWYVNIEPIILVTPISFNKTTPVPN